MRVCIVITHPTQFDVPVFRLGNSLIDVIYTDSCLVNNNFDPELRRNVKWEENNLEGYEYKVLPATNKFKWLYKEFKQNKYDLIITNGYHKLSYIYSIILGKFFAQKNSLRVDTVQFNNIRILKKLIKRFIYFVIKQFVDYFFTVGTLSKSFLLHNGINGRRIYFYGYVSNNNFFRANMIQDFQGKNDLKHRYGILHDKDILICVSKHNHREAPFDTIRAFSKINHKNLHLIIIGDGDVHGELKSLSSSLNLNNVTFTGYIEFCELPKYYSIAKLFIHDSHNEPWGVSVQEALSCNLAVIASDKVGAAHDLIIEGLNGYVFKAGKQADLCEKIIKGLLLDKEIVISTNQSLLTKWNYEYIIENIKQVTNN